MKQTFKYPNAKITAEISASEGTEEENELIVHLLHNELETLDKFFTDKLVSIALESFYNEDQVGIRFSEYVDELVAHVLLDNDFYTQVADVTFLSVEIKRT